MIGLLLAAAAAAQCDLSPGQTSRQLSLGYEQFDTQAGPDGWRQLNARGCVDTAVRLLQDYFTANGNRLTSSERSEIAFHRGQALAFAGRDAESVRHFEEALRMGGDDEWMTYVEATLAFLRRDREALNRARERYAKIAPDSMRLNVLDGFLKCNGESYAKAVHCAM